MKKRFLSLGGMLVFAALLRADANAPADYLPDNLPTAESHWIDLLGDVEVVAPEVGEPPCTADFAGCRATDTFSADFLLSVIRLPLPPDAIQLLAQPATLATPPQELSGAWLWISVLMAMALAGARAFRALRTKG